MKLLDLYKVLTITGSTQPWRVSPNNDNNWNPPPTSLRDRQTKTDLPNEGGLADPRPARRRTEAHGLILAALGAEVRRIDALAEAEAPALDIDPAQEASRFLARLYPTRRWTAARC
jgi:hypothetical protein